MLPGLVLTVGLIAQSIGALVTPAAPNPDAPRFVNIGDDIIQSATAKPIAPEGVCAPAVPEPPLVLREVVFVETPPEETTEMAPVSADQHIGYGVEPIAVFYPRLHPRLHPRPHPAPHRASHPQTAHMTLQPVMLPPFPTVLLPPQPTVLLPAGFTPPASTSLRAGPSTSLRAGG